MEAPIKLIDELNKQFASFYSENLSNANNQLFFQETELDFNDSITAKKNNVILVFPYVTGNQRRSIGETYLLGITVLYGLRLYTNKNAGNLEHQKIASIIGRFFSIASPESGFRTADLSILGGSILPTLPKWIVSTIACQFETRVQASLTP